MRKAWQPIILSIACGGLISCPGGGEGGKSSDAPLLVALSATPNPTWLDGKVTFNATCVSALGNTQLSYTWKFSNNEADTVVTTTEPATDIHTFTMSGSYSYTVTCKDLAAGTSTTATGRIVDVANFHLNVVAADVCSSGRQGFGWCWQHPLPTGSTLRAVAVPSALTEWIVGDAGTVLETNDGGFTWQARYPGVSSDLLAIQASDQNKATVVARDGGVLSTSDAGSTWSRKAPTAPQNFTSVSLVTPDVTWAISANDGIVETRDGGSSWAQVATTGVPADATLAAIAASSDTRAWVVGTVPPNVTSGVIAQNDGGGTWSAMTFTAVDLAGGSPTDYSGAFLTSVSLTADNQCSSSTGSNEPSVWVGGYVVGYTPGKIETRPLTSVSLESINGQQFSVSADGNGSGNANSSGGPVVYGLDASTAWSAAIPTSYFPLTDLSAVAATSVAINHTFKGNAAWVAGSALNFPYPVSITALGGSSDCQSGLAVGTAGIILGTTDGGSTWHPEFSSASDSMGTANLVSIAAANGNTAYALEEINTTLPVINPVQESASFAIFSTTDGGLTWTAQTPLVNSAVGFGSNSPISLNVPIQFPVGQIATNGTDTVAVGPGFILSVTPNGGWNMCTVSSCGYDESASVFPWYNINCPADGPTGVFRVGVTGINACSPSQLWVAVSLSSNAAWVTDGLGDILEQDFPTYGAQWNFVSIAPLIQQTVNPTVNGTTYPVPPPGPASSSQTVAGIAAIDPSTAVVVGSGGLISRTTTKGNSWTPISSGTTNPLNAISIATSGKASGTGWAVGVNGTVLKTTDFGQTWSLHSWTGSTISLSGVNFTSVTTPDGNNVWAIGTSTTGTSVVIYSSDAGNSWIQQQTGAQALASVQAVDANTAWLAGPNGAILKTLTGGNAPSD